eukprot:9068759-Pyramimonas_sp.AAC.1
MFESHIEVLGAGGGDVGHALGRVDLLKMVLDVQLVSRLRPKGVGRVKLRGFENLRGGFRCDLRVRPRGTLRTNARQN